MHKSHKNIFFKSGNHYFFQKNTSASMKGALLVESRWAFAEIVKCFSFSTSTGICSKKFHTIAITYSTRKKKVGVQVEGYR